MRLLKEALLALAFAQMKFWDAPASEMGITSPDSGDGDRGGNDRGEKTAGDDVDDGQGDDQAADEEHDDADASSSRGSERGDDNDQDDEDDDDEEDDEDDNRPAEERLKKVLKAKRRLERKTKKLAPTMARLKELQDAGLDLDTLIGSHRSLASMQRRLEENPKLRALIEGDEADRSERGSKSPAKREVKYPFNVENESGKFFKTFHEEFLTLKEQLESSITEMQEQLGGVTRERSQERTQRTVTEWKSAADTAAKALPQNVRKLFTHAVGLEMRRAIRGEIKATPQQVIDFYLKDLAKDGQISKASSERASGAARESIARRNNTLPRRPAGAGRPGPQQERKLPRLSDFGRSLRSKFGGQ